MIAPIETGRQQRVLILCFAPAIQSAAALMASDDDNSVRLPVDPRFLTPPSRLVTIGNFRGIPARERPARSVARDELKTFAEHGRAPHPIHNPAKSGTATDEEALDGNFYFKFRLNYVNSVLFCFFISCSTEYFRLHSCLIVDLVCCCRIRFTSMERRCRVRYRSKTRNGYG